jgi:phage terminase large subunit-like protein
LVAAAPPRKPRVKDHVTAYAKRVVEGKLVAGRLVRLACERHLRDLIDGPARGLVWDVDMANRAIEFFPDVLTLTEGEHAGKPFQLEPWQMFVIGSLFGWYGADGYRRFRTAYVEVAKGNGKSPMAGGVGLYGLIADDEEGAQIYSAAVVKDQAKILFNDAKHMVEASPYLSEVIEVGAHNLAVLATNSFFRPVSSEHRGLDGKRVHMGLIDELHEHPTDIVYEKMRAGTKGRRNPLILEITNSGYNRQTVCWQHHEYSEKVLAGVVENDSWFAYVAQLDACASCTAAGHMMANADCEECDGFEDERVWLKANPNLGVSVSRKYLREQVAEARGMPAKRNIVLRLNFCLWTQQATKWINMDVWNACRGDVNPEALYGRVCFGGLDLASTQDLCSLALHFPPLEEGERHKVLWIHWVPENSILERAARDRVPYDLWQSQGDLRATEGDFTDYDVIRRDILEVAETFNLRELAIDRWNATQLTTQLMGDGITVVPFGQGFASMSAPTKEADRLLRAGDVEHSGDPVATWAATNVAVEQDAAGNMKPSKAKSTERIDPIVAWVMALGRATVHEGEQMAGVMFV